MKKSIEIMRIALLPLSWLYGLIIFVRNYCYDKGWFVSEKYRIPVLSVGNITVGGTGKTPHTEYLIRLLRDDYKIAVLSRGYGRKTKGFIEVVLELTATEVGDEPLQMKQKFPEITVAVDEDRRNGISLLQEQGIELVLLDDAFQHRAVIPRKSILLMDYGRLPHKDYYLPTGNLRDGLYSVKRADIVLVTKSPQNITEAERVEIQRKNKIKQPVFFTHLSYGDLSSYDDTVKIADLANYEILLVTGIANPKPLELYLKAKNANVSTLHFPDHYHFSFKDLSKIKDKWEKIQSDNKLILTTEKDKVKLQWLLNNSDSHLIEYFYYLPVTIAFEKGAEVIFRRLLEV